MLPSPLDGWMGQDDADDRGAMKGWMNRQAATDTVDDPSRRHLRESEKLNEAFTARRDDI